MAEKHLSGGLVQETAKTAFLPEKSERLPNKVGTPPKGESSQITLPPD
jgi:hypothetical protein